MQGKSYKSFAIHKRSCYFNLRMILKLSKLPRQKSALLKDAPVYNPHLKRLNELGFVKGALVKLLHKGPLGSPLLFAINDTQIAIRAEEAALFQVEII